MLCTCSVQCVSLHLSLSCVFPEPSLTPHNLSTVLHSMEDEQWDVFGDYANIPSSELSKIQSQYDSERERKQAVSHSLISDHPAPSWDLVAYTLYRMRSDDSHRALEHLQQLFPTGIHVYNFLYTCIYMLYNGHHVCMCICWKLLSNRLV